MNRFLHIHSGRPINCICCWRRGQHASFSFKAAFLSYSLLLDKYLLMSGVLWFWFIFSIKTQDYLYMWCNEPITLPLLVFAAESLTVAHCACSTPLHTVFFFALNIFAFWLDSSDRQLGSPTVNMLAKSTHNQLIHPNGHPTKRHTFVIINQSCGHKMRSFQITVISYITLSDISFVMAETKLFTLIATVYF